MIDLGSVYSGIFSFCARFASASSYGIYLPNEVVFYVSADGAEYTLVGEGAFDSLDDRTVSICSLTAKDRIAARYIKAVIKGSGKIFTDEIFAVRHIIYDRGNGTAADTQGLVYGVDGDSAFVTGYDPSVTLEDTRLSALIPSSADGLTDGTSYIIGRGTDAETTVTAEFLSTSRPNHPNLYTANITGTCFTTSPATRRGIIRSTATAYIRHCPTTRLHIMPPTEHTARETITV